MELILFIVVMGALLALLFWFARWLNSQGVLLPYQKRILAAHDADIAALDFDIKLLQKYGPIVISLGDLELRETAAVLSDPTARAKNSPVQAILIDPKVQVEVNKFDDLSIVQNDPKRRSTATRVAVGGALGGAPGAAIGGMAKKTTVPGSIELRNDGGVLVTVFSGGVPARKLEVALPAFEHKKALEFRSECKVRCQSSPRWDAAHSPELKRLIARRDALREERASTEAKWKSRNNSD